MGLFLNWQKSSLTDTILDALFRGSSLYSNYGSFGMSKEESNAQQQQIIDLIKKYGITENQIRSVLQGYFADSVRGNSNLNLPKMLLEDLQKMDSWNDIVGEAPELPNPQDFYDEAEQAINKENEELSAIYDSVFNNQKDVLQQSLNENSAMFGDFRNQILTNDAMNQQAIAGAARYELDRQQRNAITRGASAAQRLVANINTDLGLQARSAQQSLDTSNALAQNLLAHRQAQQGIRNSYMQAQNDDAMRRADLIRGRSERMSNYQTQRLGQAMDAYDIENQRYNERRSKIQGTNPFQPIWESYYHSKQNGGI